MQTSTIMLDTSLGKILSAKQVDSSMQIDSEDKQKIETSESSRSTTSEAEAEVRLVVRFIVEEHIVFRGKVERVHQLESEELSRVVSRVAWDGAKDSDKSSSCNKDGQTRFEEASAEQGEQVPHATCTSTNTTTIGSAAIREDTVDPDDKSAELALDTSASNTESTSDHEVYIKASSVSEIPTKPEDEENIVAQVDSPQALESKTTTDCDTNLEQPPLNHICETDLQCLQDPTTAQEIDKRDFTDTFAVSVSSNSDFENSVSNQTPDSVCSESQSIAETLNDCVNNVDIESRQNAIEPDDHIFRHEDPADSERPKHLVHTEPINHNNLDGEAKQSVAGNHGKRLDTEQVPRARASLEEETDCSSNKKKANRGEHNSSGKRIRRTTPKDQRNLMTRTSANKTIENATASTAPILANYQQLRSNKIFAKWTDNHFYPGTIVKPAKDRKFVVRFYDGAQRSVAETDLIPLCNIEGKQVRVTIAKNYCVNAIVHDQHSPINDQPMFDVEYQQDGLVRKCVPLEDIFLTGDQGTPLINQPDRNPGASNFADVDLDNIIYEKRSRRLQEMEDYELTEISSTNGKRKRGNVLELGQEFLFTSSSPHRTKASLLL